MLLALSVALGACAIAQKGATPAQGVTRSSQPAFLIYAELVTLEEQETIEPALQKKLDTLLTTPFINNEAYFAGAKPMRPDVKGLGPSLRVVQWNIERGIHLVTCRRENVSRARTPDRQCL